MEPTVEKEQSQTEMLASLAKAVQGDNVTRTTFVQGIKLVLNHVKGNLGKTNANVDKITKSIGDVISAIHKKTDATTASFKDEMTRLHERSLGDMQKEFTKRAAKITRGKDGKTPIRGYDYPTHEQVGEIVQKHLGEIVVPEATPGRDGSPDAPEAIRDKLGSLEGDARLPAAAVVGLAEMDERIKKIEKLPHRGGNGDVIASRAGRVQQYDLSASLNGTAGPYQLPAFFTVIAVYLSSAPGVCRPIIDYSIDPVNMQITFLSTIIPATQLSAGQTCVIVYQEL